MRARALVAVIVLLFPTLLDAQACKWSWRGLFTRPFAFDALGCTPKAECKVHLLRWRKCWPRGGGGADASKQTSGGEDASSQATEPVRSELALLNEAEAAGESGEFTRLIALLTSGSQQGKERSAWALWSLAEKLSLIHI